MAILKSFLTSRFLCGGQTLGIISEYKSPDRWETSDWQSEQQAESRVTNLRQDSVKHHTIGFPEKLFKQKCVTRIISYCPTEAS